MVSVKAGAEALAAGAPAVLVVLGFPEHTHTHTHTRGLTCNLEHGVPDGQRSQCSLFLPGA